MHNSTQEAEKTLPGPSEHTDRQGDDADAPLLVSACLLGECCRYNGVRRQNSELLDEVEQGRLIPVCPEVLGGLPTPRPPADIVATHSGSAVPSPEYVDGSDVLDGAARVMDANGQDVTDAFLEGARLTLAKARAVGARAAILKSRSPSCGSGTLSRDSGTVTPGHGVTAELLRREGIDVHTAEFDE